VKEEVDRRSFLLGASALVALCPIDFDRSAPTASSSRAARGKVDSYTIDLANAERKLDIYNVRLRNYGSPGRTPTIPGPLIETRGGRTLRIKLRNRISKAEGVMDGDMDKAPAGLDPHNNPHGFDITNLHVHGVQTVPHLFHPIGTSKLAAPSIAVSPGDSYTWDFPIPKDQPAGLYAYHPHWHGSTGTQVMSGAAGGIIIRGAIDDVPEIKACREQVVAINSIYLTDAGQPPGRFGLNFTPYVPPPPGYTEEDFHIYTVNGQPVSKVNAPNPSGSPVTQQLDPAVVKVRPGEIVRLRFLNATETDTLRLVSEAGDMRWYSQDGINFQKLVQTGTSSDNCVFMPPLARSEVLLRAPEQPGEFFITSLANAPQTYSYAGMPEIRLLRVVVAGEPKRGMRFPEKLPVPVREYPLIRDEDITARRTIRWTEESPAPQMILGTAFQINGKSYDPDEALVRTRVGAVEEWSFVNESSEGHPAHVHVNSMQVDTAYLSPTQPRHCDVLWVPANSTVKVRIRFKQWHGKAVIHCHILYHEDQGMMTNMIIKKAPRS